MIIHHFDTFTGRFIELEVSDAQVAERRQLAEAQEGLGLARARATRRCLRLLDAGATPEHAVGLAFSSGFVQGSKAEHLTQHDTAILDLLSDLDDHDLARLKERRPALVAAIDAQRAAEPFGDE